MNKHFVLVLFLLRAIHAPLSCAAGMPRLETSADAMGATFSVVLYGPDRIQLRTASEDAFREARRIDLLLSNYKPESEWSRVNREAAERPVGVSRELFDLLAACERYSRMSEGTFDITVGPLMKIWGFYRGTGHLPKAGEVEQAMGQTGYRNVLLDPSNRTVFFTKHGIELDPGGVGKGYAVDRMLAVLRKDHIESALISAGGSSIYALGAPPDQAGWNIRIADPRNEEKAAAEIVLKNESLSTSGSSEKFFVAEGRTLSHIMDPRTGYPAAGTLAVSVIAPQTLDSEVWAKPYFILGRQWAATHKPRNSRVFFCEDKAEKSCAWLQ